MRNKKLQDEKGKWQCSRCKSWLEPKYFYKDSRNPNGLKSQCKKCHTECNIRTRDNDLKRDHNRDYMRKKRDANKDEFRKKEKHAARLRLRCRKVKARYMLNYAVKKGDVIKPKLCNSCSKNKKLTAHHEDYNKPYDVIWLCYECHGLYHRN